MTASRPERTVGFARIRLIMSDSFAASNSQNATVNVCHKQPASVMSMKVCSLSHSTRSVMVPQSGQWLAMKPLPPPTLMPIIFQSVLKFPRHHRLQSPSIEPYSPAWYAPATTGQLADSLFDYRSGWPWFDALCACHKLRGRGQSN